MAENSKVQCLCCGDFRVTDETPIDWDEWLEMGEGVYAGRSEYHPQKHTLSMRDGSTIKCTSAFFRNGKAYFHVGKKVASFFRAFMALSVAERDRIIVEREQAKAVKNG